MLAESDSEDSHNVDDADHSSASSSVVIPNSGVVLPVDNTVNNVVAVDWPVVIERNVDNPFGHRCLKYHVPNFYYVIYHSDDSDDVNLEKL